MSSQEAVESRSGRNDLALEIVVASSDEQSRVAFTAIGNSMPTPGGDRVAADVVSHGPESAMPLRKGWGASAIPARLPGNRGA